MLEKSFDAAFATALALREKQIQQSYRPLIGIHKWFARRPGTLFRSLLLAEYNCAEPLDSSYWRSHELRGTIADPFMGGGTTVFEANRLGFNVIGADINPMAYWIVRQALAPFDREAFFCAAEGVAERVEALVGDLYRTKCQKCRRQASVKYFIWVKVEDCPFCGAANDLFPGCLLAEAVRHPRHVVACGRCGHLNEYGEVPKQTSPAPCAHCGEQVWVEGPAKRQRIDCRKCGREFAFPQRQLIAKPLRHRPWAIEYHCEHCKPSHEGRFFKKPDRSDLERVSVATAMLRDSPGLPIPEDEIPPGDETTRLHRWGYRRYREMFSDRQLLGLGLLLREICEIKAAAEREALLTVFSDFLRYQNMLCRYDTYALKCQDIFSVHGFPVGLVQCENNLLGIPKVGSGSFRHFVEKYVRAKNYCARPFETRVENGKKRTVPIEGERIEARLVDSLPEAGQSRRAFLCAAPAATVDLKDVRLDGVFTDPPYFDNVQYAELMDFCFVWLRLGLRNGHSEFEAESTRHANELTGNLTLSRGLEAFTDGLAQVFRTYAAALKPGAPFVFTYHHNDPFAYLPLVVAILDSGLTCAATLPAAGEMSASLHIAGTGSSVLDSIFVCRHARETLSVEPDHDVGTALRRDIAAMEAAGVRVSQGDIRCLLAGHVARLTVNALRSGWRAEPAVTDRLAEARRAMKALVERIDAAGELRAIGTHASTSARAILQGEKGIGASI